MVTTRKRPQFRTLRTAVAAIRAGAALSNAFKKRRANRFRSKPNVRIRADAAVSRSSTGTRTRKRTKIKYGGDPSGLREKMLSPIVLYKKLPNHGKLLGTYHYKNVDQRIVQDVNGIQAVDYIQIFGTRQQLSGAVTSGLRTDRYTWYDSPYELNPFSQVPTTTVYPNPVPLVARNDMLYIKNVDWKVRFVSMVQYPQEVIVDFMTPVFDCVETPIDRWIQILQTKHMGQDNQATANNLATITAIAGYATVNDVGQRPFQNQEFRSTWKSLKTLKFLLQPGEQQNFHFKVLVEKIFAKSVFETRTVSHLAGITIWPLVTVTAGLVGVSTAEGVPATEVTFGSTKVGIVSEQNINFGALPQSRFSSSRTYKGTLTNHVNAVRVITEDDDIVNPVNE